MHGHTLAVKVWVQCCFPRFSSVSALSNDISMDAQSQSHGVIRTCIPLECAAIAVVHLLLQLVQETAVLLHTHAVTQTRHLALF